MFCTNAALLPFLRLPFSRIAIYINSCMDKLIFFLWYGICVVIAITFIFYIIFLFWSFFNNKLSPLHHCQKRQYANEIFATFQKVPYDVILISYCKSTLFRVLRSPLGASIIYSRPHRPTGGLTSPPGTSRTYWGLTDLLGP